MGGTMPSIFFMERTELDAYLKLLSESGITMQQSMGYGLIFSSLKYPEQILSFARLYEFHLISFARLFASGNIDGLINTAVEEDYKPETIDQVVSELLEQFPKSKINAETLGQMAVLLGVLCYSAAIAQDKLRFDVLFVRAWCAYFGENF